MWVVRQQRQRLLLSGAREARTLNTMTTCLNGLMDRVCFGCSPLFGLPNRLSERREWVCMLVLVRFMGIYAFMTMSDLFRLFFLFTRSSSSRRRTSQLVRTFSFALIENLLNVGLLERRPVRCQFGIDAFTHFQSGTIQVFDQWRCDASDHAVIIKSRERRKISNKIIHKNISVD